MTERPETTPGAEREAAPGRLIVLYGVNNLGKSTQLDLLEKALEATGHEVSRYKYPNYDSASGEIINQNLREGREDDPLALQTLMAVNLFQGQEGLRSELAAGKTVIVEDYWGTTLAWSLGHELSEDWVRAMVEGLQDPDVAVLLRGERFTEAKEAGHVHESNDDLTERVQQLHLKLAEEFGWHSVDANRSIAEVHADIMKTVSETVTA